MEEHKKKIKAIDTFLKKKKQQDKCKYIIDFILCFETKQIKQFIIKLISKQNKSIHWTIIRAAVTFSFLEAVQSAFLQLGGKAQLSYACFGGHF